VARSSTDTVLESASLTKAAPKGVLVFLGRGVLGETCAGRGYSQKGHEGGFQNVHAFHLTKERVPAEFGVVLFQLELGGGRAPVFRRRVDRAGAFGRAEQDLDAGSSAILASLLTTNYQQ
jgi:hypothetical protein